MVLRTFELDHMYVENMATRKTFPKKDPKPFGDSALLTFLLK